MKPPLDVFLRSHARTCPGKRKFASKRDVKRAIKHMKLGEKCVKAAYLCSHCGHWHMGTKKARKEREEEVHRRAVVQFPHAHRPGSTGNPRPCQ